jgi:hypothetical protein
VPSFGGDPALRCPGELVHNVLPEKIAATRILPLLARRPNVYAATGLVTLLLVCWSVVVTLSLNCRLVF